MEVTFIFGSLDDTTTAKQGQMYYTCLLQESTPFLSKEVIYGATHEMTSTNQGAQALEKSYSEWMYVTLKCKPELKLFQKPT